MSDTTAAPGWYQDPYEPGNPGARRYWDGAAWTAHTVVATSAAPSPGATAAPAPGGTAGPAPAATAAPPPGPGPGATVPVAGPAPGPAFTAAPFAPLAARSSNLAESAAKLSPVGVACTLFGLLLALLGSFLPWVNIVTLFGRTTIDGTNTDGRYSLLMALVGLAACVVWLVNRRREVAWGLATVSGSLLVFALYELGNLSNFAPRVSGRLLRVEPASGLGTLVVGALIATVGSGILALATRAPVSPSESSRLPPAPRG